MVLGALFLLAFGGGLEALHSMRPNLLTPVGKYDRVRRARIGVVVMAAAAWGTVLTGTWVVYPWYRDASPQSPRSTFHSIPK
jgi:hypothetical protein